MKLIRFTTAHSPNPQFGTVIREHAVPFSVLQTKAEVETSYLGNSGAYLANLPESELAAKKLLAWGEEHFDQGERI